MAHLRRPGRRRHRELIQGAILFGLVLIIVGLLVGPGGVSIFNGRARV